AAADRGGFGAGQHQHDPAAAGPGESAGDLGDVHGGQPQPSRVGARRLGDRDHVRDVEVRAEAGGALPQRLGGAAGGVQEFVEQVAAHPVLGLGGGAADQQQQRGDHGGAFQDALAGGVQFHAAQFEGAE